MHKQPKIIKHTNIANEFKQPNSRSDSFERFAKRKKIYIGTHANSPLIYLFIMASVLALSNM
jgi:hypothetical protein